jgi:NAD-dependent oxidoreductase involved in siderophore biosynthesis
MNSDRPPFPFDSNPVSVDNMVAAIHAAREQMLKTGFPNSASFYEACEAVREGWISIGAAALRAVAAAMERQTDALAMREIESGTAWRSPIPRSPKRKE